jgi:hypothetical protein
MNGVKNEMHVRIEQTARGVWYCSGLDVYAENHMDIAIQSDLAMTMIESMLFKHNQANEEDRQHTDLSTAGPPAARPVKVRQ